MAFEPGTIVTEDSRNLLKKMAVAIARDNLLINIQKICPHGFLAQLGQIEKLQTLAGQFNSTTDKVSEEYLLHSRIVSTIATTLNGQACTSQELADMVKSVYDSASAILINRNESRQENFPAVTA